MTKQEEIREGIARILWEIDRPGYVPNWDELKQSTHEQCLMGVKNTLIDTQCILQYLGENDVVIKDNRDPTDCGSCPVAVVCGYVAVEPLIEVKDE